MNTHLHPAQAGQLVAELTEELLEAYWARNWDLVPLHLQNLRNIARNLLREEQ